MELTYRGISKNGSFVENTAGNCAVAGNGETFPNKSAGSIFVRPLAIQK